MSGIAGLNGAIIDALLRNLELGPITQTELGNFLRGRKTTVTDPDEFARGARSIVQDTEAMGGLEAGSVIGEVIGALEGGLVVAKAQEIVSSLRDLMRGGDAEDTARSSGRARGDGGGPIYGPIGVPAATARALEEQLRQARARDAKAGVVPEERKFGSKDPRMRQRPGKAGPVEDVFEDVDIEGGEEKKEDAPEEEKVRPTRTPPETFPPLPLPASIPQPLPTGKGRKKGPKKEPAPQIPPKKQETTMGASVPGVQAVAIDPGALRPEFTAAGTDIIDKEADRVPENIENQEWIDFAYVSAVDDQNLIELDNLYADGKIRYREPMFLPSYQNPPPSPTYKQMDATTTPMIPEIQLYQSFQRKFDPADFQSRAFRNNYTLSMEYDPQPYNPRLWGKQKTWNPL